MKATSSGITGSRNPARTQPSETGLRPGATGSEIATGTAGGVLVIQQAEDPAETDANLQASLKQLLGRPVVLKDHSLYGDHGFERTIVERAILPAGTTREAARRALALIEAASQPAAPGELGEALAKLMVKTARRNQGAVDAEATVSAYIEELLAYPSDVALAALARRRKWWPTWDELAEDCDRLTTPRRAIQRALEQLLAAPERPAPIKRIPGSPQAWDEARERHGIPRRTVQELEPKKAEPRPPDQDQIIARDLGPEVGKRYLLARMAGKERKEAVAAALYPETAEKAERETEKTEESA